MSNPIFTPLVEASIGETPASLNGQPLLQLPEIVNYAEDDKTRDMILDEVYPILERTRNDRQALENEWNDIRRMEMLQFDSNRKYMGRSQAYLPIYQNILKSQTSNYARGLFPSDEYMDVSDKSGQRDEDAKKVKAYLQWEFERVANLRGNIKPWLRQLSAYGTSPLKFIYRKEMRYEGRNSQDKLTGALMSQFKPMPYCEGLHLSPRNLFNFYVYPMTADRPSELIAIFEDVDVTLDYMREQQNAGRWKNVDAALSEIQPPQHISNMAQQSVATGFTAQSDINELMGKRYAGRRTVTEIWMNLVLPKSAYLPGENLECAIPAWVVMAGKTVLWVSRNPYFHQCPPYLIGRMNHSPGFFYGYGLGRSIRSMQYLANDFANQTNDNGIYAMNPIVLYNPGSLAGPLRPLTPGVTWATSDVNSIKFERPPSEGAILGMQMLNMIVGQAQDFSGTPPILQGLNAGKGAKTATSSQILQRNAMNPVQDVIEDLEADIFVPLMHGTWLNAQQYRTQQVITMVSGGPVQVTPADLVLDPEFRWLASNQAANASQRAQQALQMVQSVLPAVPLLQQQGKIVDFAALFKRIWFDGLGFRNFDEFIRPAQAMAGVPPGAPPGPDQMGGIQQEQGDRIRSALEQIGGPGGVMAPGEGEDFAQVRDNADSLAAIHGGGQG